jgi:hypothetical protein
MLPSCSRRSWKEGLLTKEESSPLSLPPEAGHPTLGRAVPGEGVSSAQITSALSGGVQS